MVVRNQRGSRSRAAHPVTWGGDYSMKGEGTRHSYTPDAATYENG